MELTLADAWALWWSGQQLTDHTLYGVPVLWLGRIGKLLGFLAGATLVLDAIGPERLVEWGERTKGSLKDYLSGKTAYLFAALLTTPPMLWVWFKDPDLSEMNELTAVMLLGVTAVLLFVGSALTIWLGPRLVVGLGTMLASRRLERVVRSVAVPLFFIGFGLDYLAS